MTQNILLVRGTSWINLWRWRVRELRGEPRDWSLINTSEPLSEYHSIMTSVEAARLALRQFPGARIYMRADDPNAAPRNGEKITVARVMLPVTS